MTKKSESKEQGAGKNSKPQAPSQKIEELLTEAGFQTLEKRGERIVIASGAEDFSKSHAAFLQAADKHPALIGCSEFPGLGNRTLIVHRRKAAKQSAESIEHSEEPHAPSAMPSEAKGEA